MCRRFAIPFLALCLLVAVPVLAEEAAPQEQGKVTASSCQRCGDGYCARSCENERTCPADCAPQTAAKVAIACGKCGDGTCVKQCGETPESCPADCGYSSPSAASADTQAVPCDAKPKTEPKKE